MSKRSPMIYTLFIFAVAGSLAGIGGANHPSVAPAAAVAAGPLALPALEGTWSGTWTDTLFAVTGGVSLVIWSEGPEYVATGTIDVTQISPVLGVLSGGATSLDSGVTLDVTFDCADLGNGTVVLTPAKSAGGALSATAAGTGNVISPLNFGPFTLTGTVTDNLITGSFDFTSPGGGKGIASFTKTSVPVQSVSWGSAKAAYRQR